MTDEAVSCSGCGRTPPGGRLPLDWSVSLDIRGDDQVRRVLCAECTRTHARSIEAKLDEDFWE